MRTPRLVLACTVALVGCPGSDEGSEPPPECAAAGGALADFSVRFPDAPEMEAAHRLVVPCTVTDITSPGAEVVTELICKIVDTPDSLVVEIVLPVTSAGPISWGVDDMVFLQTIREGDAALGEEVRRLRMDQTGGTLVVGVEAGDPDLEWYAPFSVTASSPCGEEARDGEPGLPLMLDFRRDDVGVAIFSGHRDTLALGGRTFAIDVGEATTNHCCHATRRHKVLFRSIQP